MDLHGYSAGRDNCYDSNSVLHGEMEDADATVTSDSDLLVSIAGCHSAGPWEAAVLRETPNQIRSVGCPKLRTGSEALYLHDSGDFTQKECGPGASSTTPSLNLPCGSHVRLNQLCDPQLLVVEMGGSKPTASRVCQGSRQDCQVPF